MAPRKRPPGRPTARVAQQKKRLFLDAYRKIGVITAAAAAVGISRRSHVDWMKQASYRAEFERAEDEAIEVLEQEALRRAVEGREEPVFYNGVQVGSVRRPSDVLLIFMLKSKRPEIYRERFDARINANMNVASMVKVVHEYHDQPPAIEAVQAELEASSKLLTATAVEVLDQDEPPDDETDT